MSFRIFVTFFMLFSHWIAAETIANHLRNRRPEERRQRFLLEDADVFVGPSQVTDMTHSVRRSLKLMRKWCRTHPIEVKLGTCLASYFDIKIPGLRRTEQLEDYKEFSILPSLEDTITIKSQMILMENDRRGRRFPRKDRSTEDNLGGTWNSTTSAIETALHGLNLNSLREYYRNVMSNFFYYRDLIANNRLTVCIWNYVVRKFWIWVDSAPID